jgi:glycosyltransferase involved in cell wall biosynthesis
MGKNLKIHCIALTKNEEDVIEDCLLNACRWADKIYVYDGASTDRTWEIVQSLESEKVIPWKQDGKVFSEGLRAEVFEAFRHESETGDWWLQLNVDEYYRECPRNFFARIPRSEDFVWGITVEYYLTERDLETIDFSKPFHEVRPQLKYYQSTWSEPRAFRYRKGLVWSPKWAWPKHVGVVAKERIVFQHYPFRSPQQIQTRLDVRRENRSRGFEGWDHAKEEDWRDKIVKAEGLNFDDGGPFLGMDLRKMPRHLEKPHVRLLKKILHGLGVWA